VYGYRYTGMPYTISQQCGRYGRPCDEGEGVIPRMLAGGSAADAPTTDATRRIAVVDQEWQHIRAVDILVVLRSFAPKIGGAFTPHCLLTVHQCTSTRGCLALHGARSQRGLHTSLFAPSASVYLYTLAASSSLAWPPVPHTQNKIHRYPSDSSYVIPVLRGGLTTTAVRYGPCDMAACSA